MTARKLVLSLDAFIESCWLLALIAIPIYFDTLTIRIFEPDKIVLFRNIVIAMVIAVLARALVVVTCQPRSAVTQAAESYVGASPFSLKEVNIQGLLGFHIRRRPLLVPVTIFTLVYTAATFTSVLRRISFWGSYDRMQGLYTWLNYIVFFLILIYFVRSWRQIERIISALVFTSFPIALYGIVQKITWTDVVNGVPQQYSLDPVKWGADTSTRVASTLGNSIFLGAFLLMCMPFAIYRLWRAIDVYKNRGVSQQLPAAKSNGRPAPDDYVNPFAIPIAPPIMYAIIILADFIALYFQGSRGPYYGFVIALIFTGIPITMKLKNPGPAIGSILLGIAVAGAPTVASHLPFLNAVNGDTAHLSTVSDTGSAQVRLYIWQGSKPLIQARPWLGWGPEDMIYVYAPYYPPGLGHLERSNAAPDRNHDEWLDFLVFSGVFGLLAWLALLATFFTLWVKVLQRLDTVRSVVVVSAAGAVVIGHLAEASVGIDIVSTLMLMWAMFALITIFYSDPALGRAIDLKAIAEQMKNDLRGNTPSARSSSRAERRSNQARASAAAPPAPFNPAIKVAVGIATLLSLLIGSVLAVNNIQVIHADSDYKDGHSLEQQWTIGCLNNLQACSQQLSKSSTTPVTPTQAANYGIGKVIQSFSLLQAAVNEQPAQDAYYLGLGQGYLDLAQFYLSQSPPLVTTALPYLQNAETTLMEARKLNTYNADHPMNLARLYSLWGRFDTTKWALADSNFQIGTSIARHNGRFMDEWGASYLQEASQTSLPAAQKTLLLNKALFQFKHAASIDDQLGDAVGFAGSTYQSMSNYPDAMASFQKALKIGYLERMTTGSLVETALTYAFTSKHYSDIVKPFYLGQSLYTLTQSPAIAAQFTTNPPTIFSQQVQSQVVPVLRKQGLIK